MKGMEKVEKEALVRLGIVGLKETCEKGKGSSTGGKLELAIEHFQYQAKCLKLRQQMELLEDFSNN